MASRISNMCINASDPYAQTLWWAQVLDDFVIVDDDDEEADPGLDEWGLEGPDDRRTAPDRGWAVLAHPEGNEFCVRTPQRAGA